MRKKIIAGNWKMNKGPREALDFLASLSFEKKDQDRVILCPSNICLGPMQGKLPRGVELAAQNIHQEEAGAYTGEVAAGMIRELGVAITLVGHSERRSYYNESDEIVNKKVKRALENSLEVILCVGESLEERQAAREKALVEGQIVKALEGLDEKELKGLIIAYEPVWAIGTGLSASAEDAQEMNSHIRGVIARLYNEELAQGLLILYGGSVSPGNIKELMAKKDVDGVLVGGASLDPQSFSSLVDY